VPINAHPRVTRLSCVPHRLSTEVLPPEMTESPLGSCRRARPVLSSDWLERQHTGHMDVTSTVTLADASNR
jgi:hypothetical protein